MPQVCSKGYVSRTVIYTVCAHQRREEQLCQAEAERKTARRRRLSAPAKSDSRNKNNYGTGTATPRTPDNPGASNARKPIKRSSSSFLSSMASAAAGLLQTPHLSGPGRDSCLPPPEPLMLHIGWCPACKEYYRPLDVNNAAMIRNYWDHKTASGLHAPLDRPGDMSGVKLLMAVTAAAAAAAVHQHQPVRRAEVESLVLALAPFPVPEGYGGVRRAWAADLARETMAMARECSGLPESGAWPAHVPSLPRLVPLRRPLQPPLPQPQPQTQTQTQTTPAPPMGWMQLRGGGDGDGSGAEPNWRSKDARRTRRRMRLASVPEEDLAAPGGPAFASPSPLPPAAPADLNKGLPGLPFRATLPLPPTRPVAFASAANGVGNTRRAESAGEFHFSFFSSSPSPSRLSSGSDLTHSGGSSSPLLPPLRAGRSNPQQHRRHRRHQQQLAAGQDVPPWTAPPQQMAFGLAEEERGQSESEGEAAVMLILPPRRRRRTCPSAVMVNTKMKHSLQGAVQPLCYCAEFGRSECTSCADRMVSSPVVGSPMWI